jgi:transposase
MREIVNAILYQGRTGCRWEYLPHGLPPKSAVYYYFAAWRDDGTDVKINDLLRWQVREKAGRSEDPSLVVIDTQSVHAAVNVPAATTGKDAAKKVPGRKRGLAVDVLGLVIAVTVLAASAHDNAFGIALLGQVAPSAPSRRRWWIKVSRGPSSNTAPRSASTSRSSNATPPTRTPASSRRPRGGSWSRRSAS